ncbi:amidohydrolase family protein [Brevibacterium zhoupengii]|uniref:amidohydrolase family protein n=1 Tax=Brevibacterium zhoupengii TaxID=2898795 RepID=UPI001F093285|nr:amidohydrolase family protein [Brevibacterium zhoupengii]
MKSLRIDNVSGVVTGRLGEPVLTVGSVRCVDGKIAAFDDDTDADVIVDANGATLCPGLIDSHVHVTFGDWTPRQQTVGWIESYMHGGTTLMMSASEIHVPGRPTDRAGLKGLAIAAQRSWENVRPGGVKVLGGSVIISPALTEEDFAELGAENVRLAKVGFGAFESQSEAAPLVRAAQKAGFVVMNHTGGASVPGSAAVSIDDVLALECDIIGHANGGTTSLPDEDLERMFDAPGALQLVQAGNLRSSLRVIDLAKDRDDLDRILIATDTPTGTGVMPLGMIKTIVEFSSLADLSAADTIALATSNPGRVLHREEGVIDLGRPADMVLLQPPAGGVATDPLSAIERGDVPGICGVIIDGQVQGLRSRNTPAPARLATVH